MPFRKRLRFEVQQQTKYKQNNRLNIKIPSIFSANYKMNSNVASIFQKPPGLRLRGGSDIRTPDIKKTLLDKVLDMNFKDYELSKVPRKTENISFDSDLIVTQVKRSNLFELGNERSVSHYPPGRFDGGAYSTNGNDLKNFERHNIISKFRSNASVNYNVQISREMNSASSCDALIMMPQGSSLSIISRSSWLVGLDSSLKYREDHLSREIKIDLPSQNSASLSPDENIINQTKFVRDCVRKNRRNTIIDHNELEQNPPVPIADEGRLLKLKRQYKRSMHQNFSSQYLSSCRHYSDEMSQKNSQRNKRRLVKRKFALRKSISYNQINEIDQSSDHDSEYEKVKMSSLVIDDVSIARMASLMKNRQDTIVQLLQKENETNINPPEITRMNKIISDISLSIGNRSSNCEYKNSNIGDNKFSLLSELSDAFHHEYQKGESNDVLDVLNKLTNIEATSPIEQTNKHVLDIAKPVLNFSHEFENIIDRNRSLSVFRIENLTLVLVPEIGKFCDGDCYVVLKIQYDPINYEIYTWISEHAEIDKKFCSAMVLHKTTKNSMQLVFATG